MHSFICQVILIKFLKVNWVVPCKKCKYLYHLGAIQHRFQNHDILHQFFHSFTHFKSLIWSSELLKSEVIETESIFQITNFTWHDPLLSKVTFKSSSSYSFCIKKKLRGIQISFFDPIAGEMKPNWCLHLE